MERTKMTLKDLAVSFHFPKFSTSRDFYKAFGCRVCMLLSYQMISVYQLYIVEDYVHQTKTEAAGTIATMSIITMVVSLTASLISGPISDKMHTHKVPVIIASLLFAIGTAMPWIMPSVTGMYLYAGIAGGADVILIPEIPYDMDKVVETIKRRDEAGGRFSIVVVAEGAISCVAEGTGRSLDSLNSMTDGTVNLSRRKQMN